jgi:hypothetical protein
MRYHQQYAFACLTLSVCLSSWGCGPKYPNEKAVYKIQGSVSVDGAAVPEIQVAMHPETPSNAKPPTFPQGFTDAEGKLRISTYAEGDGAPAGDYKVTFIHQEYNIMSRNFSGPDKLKKKYADPKTTPFSISIGEGKPNDLGKIELTTK